MSLLVLWTPGVASDFALRRFSLMNQDFNMPRICLNLDRFTSPCPLVTCLAAVVTKETVLSFSDSHPVRDIQCATILTSNGDLHASIKMSSN